MEATLGEEVIPGLLDYYFASAAWDGAMLDEPADPDTPNNFWDPVPGDHGAHGEFDLIARSFSIQLLATKHRRALVGGFIIGAGAALVSAMGIRECRKQ